MTRWIPIRPSASAKATVAALLNQNLQEDTTVFQVDTSIARTFILPAGSLMTNISAKFVFVDISGNAGSNNITLMVANEGADTINGNASVVINTSNGVAIVTGTGIYNQSSGGFAWVCNFAGAATSSAGGGGGGVASILSFDITFTNAQIIALLEDNTASQQILPALGVNNIAQLLCVSFFEAGTTPFSYGGGGPVIIEFISSGAITPLGGYDTSESETVNSANQVPSDGPIIPNQPLLIQSKDSGTVISGDCSIRVFGLYMIKTVGLV